MRRMLTTLSLATLLLTAGAASAYALAIALPPPGPQRMGNADALILGRVIGIEPQDIEVEQFPGGGKTKFRIAVVKVNEAIFGAKDAKSVRIAFYPPPENNPGGNPIRIRPGLGRGNMALKEGQDGLFILKKHHKDNFYLPPDMFNFVSSEDEQKFKSDVDSARKAAKIVADPMAALKSKDGEERMQAAAMLINKYRNPGPAAGHKTEKVAAEESKLILTALLEGRWNAQGGRFDQIDSWNLFNQLNLQQDKDSGWKFPQNAQNITQFHDAAKAWLKDNAAKYQIEKLVPTDKPNQPQPGGVRPVDGQVQPQPLPIRIKPIQGRPIQVQPGVIRPIQIQVQPLPLPVEPQIERDR